MWTYGRSGLSRNGIFCEPPCANSWLQAWCVCTEVFIDMVHLHIFFAIQFSCVHGKRYFFLPLSRTRYLYILVCLFIVLSFVKMVTSYMTFPFLNVLLLFYIVQVPMAPYLVTYVKTYLLITDVVLNISHHSCALFIRCEHSHPYMSLAPPISSTYHCYVTPTLNQATLVLLT